MDATRQRLADNLEQLKAETTPQALAAKAKAKVTGVFVDPATGEIRRERVAAVVGVVVGVIVVRKGLKSRARRRELKRLSEVVWVPVAKAGHILDFFWQVVVAVPLPLLTRETCSPGPMAV